MKPTEAAFERFHDRVGLAGLEPCPPRASRVGRKVRESCAVISAMVRHAHRLLALARCATLAAALVLCGCAGTPTRTGEPVVAGAPSGAQAAGAGGETVRIHWHMAPLAEINAICNAGMPAKFRKSVWGCYRRAFDQCVIYTATEKEDPNLHDTIGHEVRHCFQGAFHR